MMMFSLLLVRNLECAPWLFLDAADVAEVLVRCLARLPRAAQRPPRFAVLVECLNEDFPLPLLVRAVHDAGDLCDHVAPFLVVLPVGPVLVVLLPEAEDDAEDRVHHDVGERE